MAKTSKPKFETLEEKLEFVDTLVGIFNSTANDYLTNMFNSAVLDVELDSEPLYIGSTKDGDKKIKKFIKLKEMLQLYEKSILNLIENITDDSHLAHTTITNARHSIEKFHHDEELFNKVFEDIQTNKE